jgi:hypothetical protein
MNRNTALKILGALSVIASGLLTAGVLPASLALIPTVIGVVAGALHTQVLPAVSK